MADFGAKLREARERRGVSLRDIANHTKISITALESLERNDPSRLPGGIFARAFVRSYATEVGLDPEATVREFIARFDVEPPFTAAADPALNEADSVFATPHRLLSTVLKIVVASLVAVAIILYLTRVRQSDDSTGAGGANSARRTSRRVVSSVPKGTQLP
jgi:cytoskeletal protein RodZ